MGVPYFNNSYSIMYPTTLIELFRPLQFGRIFVVSFAGLYKGSVGFYGPGEVASGAYTCLILGQLISM